MMTLLQLIEEALEKSHHPKCLGRDCDCGRDLILEGLLEMAAANLRCQEAEVK